MQRIANKISVIIPLYNKRESIARAIASVEAQSLTPREIIVIDDGSTDGSGEIVEALAATNPAIKLVHQPNGGVSAARNRAIKIAEGEFVALLDGDDRWREGYLAEICNLISDYPDCGAYATGFYVIDGKQQVVGDTPQTRGVVDFFAESQRHYVLIPSATTLNRSLALDLGGFPEGMRMGEDQYLWTKIARSAKVCISPTPLIDYSRSGENRSATIYRPEQSIHSLEDLYDPTSTDLSNEYLARVALGKALVQSIKGGTEEARRAVNFFGYTRLHRRALRKVRLLNALPLGWRAAALNIYNRLAWLIARKGL
jgi:glycosyltransferase involved in cell wall biosynthesis